MQLFLCFVKRPLGDMPCLRLRIDFSLWDFIGIGKQRLQKALRFVELVGGVAAVQQLVHADVIFADKRKARFGIQLKGNRFTLRRKAALAVNHHPCCRIVFDTSDNQNASRCRRNVYRAEHAVFSFINNDFCEADNSEFLIISHVVLKAKNNKRLIMIPINESLEPLANAFIYAVYAGNLWIHTCQRCGKLFLSDTDEKYCQAKACQHQILLDKWKNDREKNMNNETSHTLTIFRGYLRKQKNCLKNAGASEQMLSMIEHKIKELGKEAKERASVFKDTNTTPDEKFLNFCEETKKQFKSECDRLKKEIKESKNPTQPT